MPILVKPLPSAEILRNHYDYDPVTGLLSLKYKSPGHSAGFVVGSANKEGRLATRFQKKLFPVSRLIWAWMTGEDPCDKTIDHVNGDPRDNRWCNLRAVTAAENCHNRHDLEDSLSGIPGAQWIPQTCVWVVSVYHERRHFYFGTFTNPDLVVETLLAFHREKRGDFFNESVWLAHIEKSRGWIEWCRELADYNLLKQAKTKESKRMLRENIRLAYEAERESKRRVRAEARERRMRWQHAAPIRDERQQQLNSMQKDYRARLRAEKRPRCNPTQSIHEALTEVLKSLGVSRMSDLVIK